MPVTDDDRPIPRRLPTGLLGMLAAVAVVESAVLAGGPTLLSDSQWDWRHAGRAAVAEAARAEVLAFGDSQLKMALAPPVIERRLGRSAYNLAVMGGQPAADLFLLRRVLEAGGRPRAILVDFFPQFLTMPPADYLNLLGQLADLGEAADFAREAGDPELLGQLVAGRLLPSIRCRLELRGRIVGELTGRPISWAELKPALHRNWRVNRGAQLMPPNPLDYDPAAWRALAFPDRPPNRLALRYLDRFLRLAADRQIPVYWLVLPTDAALRDECARSGYDDRHDAFLRAALGRYPNLTILDGRTSEHPPAHFFDAHHLARDGAFALTQTVCDVLETPPTADRWVRLPDPIPRPADLHLEGLHESRLAVAGGDPVR